MKPRDPLKNAKCQFTVFELIEIRWYAHSRNGTPIMGRYYIYIYIYISRKVPTKTPSRTILRTIVILCVNILSLYIYSYQLSRYNDAMTCCRDTAVRIVCDRFTVTAKFRRLYSSRENHAHRHRRSNSFRLSLDCRHHVICRGKTRVSP